jgi:protein-S-isoprenylcysteine O-methyltransferase Ste14
LLTPFAVKIFAWLMLDVLRMLGWWFCIFYASVPLFWLLVHSRVAQWRSRARSPYRILIPIWVLSWIVLALVTARWRTVALYEASWTWIPAAALITIGFAIYVISARNFTSIQVSGVPEVMAGHPAQKLVTTGIRARVRHPLYLGHLCELLGWSLGTGLAVAFALTAFGMLSGIIMVRLEEKELEARFGESYRAYRRHVPMLLPLK